MKKLCVVITLLLVATLQLTAQQRNFWLYSTMTGRHLLSTGDSTWFWGYGYYYGSQNETATLPSPLLTVYVGDTMNLTFKNLTGEMHTIHLHGTDVDQRNDGSPHTWPPVNPNDSTIYTWTVAHSGSYFYHCHVMSPLHLGVGMYGMMIAKNFPDTTRLYTGGPGFNKEYTFMMTDMDTAWNNSPLSPGLLNGYIPNYFMINGYSDWMMFNRPGQIIEANAGDSICLHLGNLGYTTTRFTFPAGSNPTVYLSDARILPVPFSSDTLRVYPGERYEVILRPTTAISDWIEVEYLGAILNDSLGTNYIGFNQYVHPTSIESPVAPIGSLGGIFPNPATNSFSMEIPAGINKVQIFTADGKLAKELDAVEGMNQFECSDLTSGLYFVKCGDYTQKLVITAH